MQNICCYIATLVEQRGDIAVLSIHSFALRTANSSASPFVRQA
jgi:hypothetical protein